MTTLAAHSIHAEVDPQLRTFSGSLAAHAQSAGPSESAASIASNDFLTLLVTELKNQDPTANNDPNQYVNQLVQVNSLQQLIQINETLADKLGATSAVSPPSSGMLAEAAKAASATDLRRSPHVHTTAVHGGNLSHPVVHPSAHRVAESLVYRADRAISE